MKMGKLYIGKVKPQPNENKPHRSREYATQVINAGISTKTPSVTIPLTKEKCNCAHEPEVHMINFNHEERKYSPLGKCLIPNCNCQKFEAKRGECERTSIESF